MIQRVQTILLLLGGLCFLDMAFFQSAMTQEAMPWLPVGVLALHAVTAIGAIGAILLYKDRARQLKVVSIVQYLALASLIASFAGLYLSGAVMELPGNTGALALIILPALGYILIRMATGRIRKDIELVRSMDRLR